MDLLKQFLENIKHQNLFHPKDKLLLAVSGGVDSVVLCELCNQARYDFSIAHCNFQLRGEDSNRDEKFVKELAQKYKVPFFVKTFDTNSIAKQEKKSIEEAARDLRYAWFNEIMEEQKAQSEKQKAESKELKAECSKLKAESSKPIHHSPFTIHLLTAHHADDNTETVLMNFFRGTGIKGLHGILSKQNNIVRPLLFAHKKNLIDFAIENNLSFVSDYTNAQNDFTRNYFRNELIPSLKKIFPAVEENIERNISRFGEAEELYNQAIELHKKKLLEQKGNEIHIPVLKLQQTNPLATIVFEIIKEFNFSAHQTGEVIALLKSESGKYVQSSTHRIIRNRKWLIISPNKTIESQNILIEQGDKRIVFENGELLIDDRRQTTDDRRQTTDHQRTTTNDQPSTEFLDAAQIKFPLLLRKWKQGDYFYPLGMQKKKKLSRFFIDQKLSITEKEAVWVIEMDKKIIWVVGLRIDDRFKIRDKTKEILEISFQRGSTFSKG